MDKDINTDRRNALKAGSIGGVAAGLAMVSMPTESMAHHTSSGSKSTYVNVRDFGAKGDGIANDQVNIQRAINHVSDLTGAEFEKNKKGGTVYLPAGTYLVGNIRLRRNITLIGEGMGTIVKQIDGSKYAVIGNRGAKEYPIAIKNLRIQGTKNPGGTGENARGIYLNSTPEYGGFTVPDGQHIIDQVWIEHTHSDGIYIKDGCRGTLIKDCWVSSSETASGIWVDGSDSTVVNTISRGHKTILDEGTGGTGFKMTSGNARLLNCKAFFCRGGGFYISGSRANLSTCEAQDNWFDGFRVTGSNSIITGCLGDSNQNAGFHIDPMGGFIGGICMTGFNAFGRPEVQEAKDWVGQGTGLRISQGFLNDSYFAGIVRNNNDEQLDLVATPNTASQLQSIVIG